MKYTSNIFIIILLILSACSSKESDSSQVTTGKSILVFSKTKEYRHASIADGKAALRKLCEENGFTIDTTENSEVMTKGDLNKYAAIVFLSTSGDIFNEQEQNAFKNYIHQGGGFVGIHSATDTEYEWEWYGKFIGAYFNGHPDQQEAIIDILDNDHPATRHLGEKWVKWDEWYNYKKLNPEVNVVAKMDESSYEGGKNGDNHPIAWYQEIEGGKMFYTGLGHTRESYSDPDFLKHVWGGIEYVVK